MSDWGANLLAACDSRTLCVLLACISVSDWGATCACASCVLRRCERSALLANQNFPPHAKIRAGLRVAIDGLHALACTLHPHAHLFPRLTRLCVSRPTRPCPHFPLAPTSRSLRRSCPKREARQESQTPSPPPPHPRAPPLLLYVVLRSRRVSYSRVGCGAPRTRPPAHDAGARVLSASPRRASAREGRRDEYWAGEVRVARVRLAPSSSGRHPP